MITDPLNPTAQDWNREYKNGKWCYLNDRSSEQSRNAVIGMYCNHFFPDGYILDVGCGIGTLCRFLNEDQRNKYLGIDISKETIKQARDNYNLQYEIADASSYIIPGKFDVIIFNEVLYYTDFTMVLKKYAEHLSPLGMVIISIYQMGKAFDKIWDTADKFYQSIEEVDLATTTAKDKFTWNIKVMRKFTVSPTFYPNDL